MVGDVLQLPKLEFGAEKITGKATLCEYKVRDADQFVSIRFERGYTVDKFEGSKGAFTGTTDIPGIGERAFTASLPMLGRNTPYGINSIAVLKNHTHLTISAPVVPDRVLYLARDLLDEL